MLELMFIVAFVFFGASASIGHRIDASGGLSLPTYPLPLRIASGLSGLGAAALFLYGFIAFSWWLPLVSVPIFMVFGAYLTVFAFRTAVAPLFSIVLFLIGVAIFFGLISS